MAEKEKRKKKKKKNSLQVAFWPWASFCPWAYGKIQGNAGFVVD